MIASTKKLEKYCTDYNNIENYTEAVKSPLRYDLHHRREISENKSRKDLIAENLYYNRPATELIFLEHGEHIQLHNANLSDETKNRMSENNSRYWKGKHRPAFSTKWKQKMSEAHNGKHHSEETRQKISENNHRYWKGKHPSEETRQKISEAGKGKLKGLHWHLENGHRIWTE